MKSFSYLLKYIPRNLPIKKHFWAKGHFSIARLHIILSAAGSIVLKGQKQKIMVYITIYHLKKTLFMEFRAWRFKY